MNDLVKLSNKITNKRREILTCERKADFMKKFFKVVKFGHIGLGLFMTYIAIKEFMFGIDGLFALQLVSGIAVSGVISCGLDKLVQKYYEFKKSKLENRISELREQQNFLINERTKTNNITSVPRQTYSYYGFDKEMKLTLRK